MNPAKFWLASRTVRFAIVVALAGLGDVIAPYSDQLRQLLGPLWFTALMFAISAAIAWLRQQTAGGLTFKRQPPAPPAPQGDSS